MLAGYPVAIDNAMPVMATGNVAICFGAIREAFLIRASIVRVDVSNDYRFEKDEVTWRAVIALDSHVVDDTAIKALTMA